MTDDPIPAEVLDALTHLPDELRQQFTEALEPVALEIGPREVAVLERLTKGISANAPVQELNAFVRLLPVTVSRVLQPVLEPMLTKA
jgi:hypothetical protein